MAPIEKQQKRDRAGVERQTGDDRNRRSAGGDVFGEQFAFLERARVEFGGDGFGSERVV